jgi:hypothetical protein
LQSPPPPHTTGLEIANQPFGVKPFQILRDHGVRRAPTAVG